MNNLQTSISGLYSISNKLNNKIKTMSSVITSFQVFATDKIIPPGAKDTNDKTDDLSVAKILDFDNKTATGLTYKMPVGVQMTHGIRFWINAAKQNCDIIIDWGDGTKTDFKQDELITIDSVDISTFAQDYDATKNYCQNDIVKYNDRFYMCNPGRVSNTTFTNAYVTGITPGTAQQPYCYMWLDITAEGAQKHLDGKSGIFRYDEFDFNDAPTVATVCHTYTKAGKYIVKIYGTTYSLIRCYMGDVKYSHCMRYNLISRIFEADMSIADNLVNVSSLCYGSVRLLRISGYYDRCTNNIKNTSSLFTRCTNLQSVDDGGVLTKNKVMYAVGAMFMQCVNLLTSKISIPTYIQGDMGVGSLYVDCVSLSSNIQDLIPKAGFISYKNVNITSLFSNCLNMGGTVPAKFLWQDSNITWNFDLSSKPFNGCSNAILAQVPTSWGGINIQIENKLLSGYYNKSSDGVQDDKFIELKNLIDKLKDQI